MFSIFLTTLLPCAFATNSGHIVIYNPILKENKFSFFCTRLEKLTKFFFEYEYKNEVPLKFLLSEKTFKAFPLYVKYFIPSIANHKEIVLCNQSINYSWNINTDTKIELFNTGNITYKIKKKDNENEAFCLKIKRGKIEKELTGVQEISLNYNKLHKLGVDREETSYNLHVDPSFEEFIIKFSDSSNFEIKSDENKKDDISLIFQNSTNLEIKLNKNKI